jgi:hypothetical protein
MAFAAGPISSLLTTCAACVGAGILLGGFAAGVANMYRRRLGPGSERRVQVGGYVGGLIALVVVLAELTIR